MYRSNNQTFASSTNITGGNIIYDGIVFDPYSACNVSTGSFTVPQSGYYQFNTSTAFPTFTASATVEIRLVKNTTQPIAILSSIFGFTGETVNSRTTYPGMALVNLTAGDIINVRLFNQTGQNGLPIFGNSSTLFTRFSGDYVGA